MPTPGIDFFRVDRSGSTTRLLVSAATMVTVGGSAIGAHLIHKLSVTTGHLISLAGGVIVMAGLVMGFGTMVMMLFENIYLTIEKERVLVHVNGEDQPIAWDDLAGVRVEGNFVILERAKGEPLRFIAGAASKDLARRIEEAKRKAAHGLLDPAS
ncbi:MAG TPA: hypothetical protein VIF62_09915 [Labilithrix sp.]